MVMVAAIIRVFLQGQDRIVIPTAKNVSVKIGLSLSVTDRSLSHPKSKGSLSLTPPRWMTDSGVVLVSATPQTQNQKCPLPRLDYTLRASLSSSILFPLSWKLFPQ